MQFIDIDIRVMHTHMYIVLLRTKHRYVLSTLTASLSFSSHNLDNHNISKLLVKSVKITSSSSSSSSSSSFSFSSSC